MAHELGHPLVARLHWPKCTPLFTVFRQWPQRREQECWVILILNAQLSRARISGSRGGTVKLSVLNSKRTR